MADQASICAVCAWRETCQKKFKVSGEDIRCADYTRDVKVSPHGSDKPMQPPSNGEGK